MLNVEWIKCQGDVWCPLEGLNLSSISEDEGVYIIWHTGNPSQTVYVGKGEFQDRFQQAPERSQNSPILQQNLTGDVGCCVE